MVRYLVPLHETARFEAIFSGEFLPVIREHGIEPVGIFRTLVGDAGEYHEIWRFPDLASFEARWKSLFADSRTAALLARTGPLVRGETSRILAPAPFSPVP